MEIKVRQNARDLLDVWGTIMAMPQQDDYIEQIHRLEGLMAYAEAQQDWEELDRLKERLRRLLERV